ncbi:MAG TPA: hypothetical protein VKQ72_16810, partial [Aggregatilineales bacterium]|nr:hypothetical protein [Aggregatilineales bacterium]
FLADFPCDNTEDFSGWREMVRNGQLVEAEMNTFIDERPQPEGDDGHLPHHYSDETDVRDLLGAFEILKLWTDVRSRTPEGAVQSAKWVAWARKP